MEQLKRTPELADWELYQKRMIEFQIRPNFWCSYHYVKASGWAFYETEGWIGYCDVDDPSVSLLPPIPKPGILVFPSSINEIWADFGDNPYLNELYSLAGLSPSFMDFEYLYLSNDFKDMSGGKWATFRKNVKKWPKLDGEQRNASAIYRPILDTSGIIPLLIQWLTPKGEEEVVWDSETLTRYVIEIDNKWGLYRDDELIGFNGWDSNDIQLNYRYCFCVNEPFLSDYMRWLFYSSLGEYIWINDGGILDRPSLEFFKDRLNPFMKRKIMTWLR